MPLQADCASTSHGLETTSGEGAARGPVPPCGWVMDRSMSSETAAESGEGSARREHGRFVVVEDGRGEDWEGLTVQAVDAVRQGRVAGGERDR